MKAIIMAGGSGTRLWPLSTAESPKQFLTLKGQKFSLFQTAVMRSLLFCNLADVYVLTVDKYAQTIKTQISDLTGTTKLVNILVEPQSKNTLPAICNAVKEIRKTQNDTVVVMPSDHLIKNPEELTKRISEGSAHTDKYIYTFGIKPKYPDTGFGYIRTDGNIEAGFKIAEFREKPTLVKAEEFVRDGYLWNSGLFMFDTDVFVDEVKLHAPAVYEAFEAETAEECFEKTPAVSIDYGVMEKSSKTAVLRLDMDWDDLGVFETFYNTFANESDADGNVLLGNGKAVNSKGTLVYSDTERQFAAVGVENLIIVDSNNGLLVCKKGESQKIKEVNT